MAIDRSSLIGITLPAGRHTLDQHAEWFSRFHAVLKKDCGLDWLVFLGIADPAPQFRIKGLTRPRIRKAFRDAVRVHRPSGHRMCLLGLTYWNEHHVLDMRICGSLEEANIFTSSTDVSLSFSSTCRIDAKTRLNWFRAMVEIYPARSGRFTSTTFSDRVEQQLGSPDDGFVWDLFDLGWAMYRSEPAEITPAPSGWTVRADGRGGSLIEMRPDQLGSLNQPAIDLGCDFLRADPSWPQRFIRERQVL